MSEVQPGQFEGTLTMTESGLYTLRVRAQGETFRGSRFQREQTLTAVAYPAGYVPPTGDEGEQSELCRIIECLFNRGVLTDRALERLRALGIDAERLRKCLGEHCRDVSAATIERQIKRVGRGAKRR